MTKRIKGLPYYWQDYLLCLLFHMALPFLPILLENIISSHVEAKSFMLFVAMYSLAIGISSSSPLLLGITISVSIFYSVFFGVSSNGVELSHNVILSAWISLLFIFFTHALERYNKHIIDRTPFWSFSQFRENNH